MPLPVLERVERRRRRRRRLPLALLSAAVLVAAGVAGAWQLRSTGGEGEGARAAATMPTTSTTATTTGSPEPESTTTAPATMAPAELLTGSTPRNHHVFRPRLGASGAILVDAATGTVLWSYRARSKHPIASTTKIMTATLVLERLSLDHVVTVDPSVPRVPPFREGLRAGERVPVWKLLYGLMLFSGNDDAVALGIEVSGSRWAFLRLMNRKARELGLRDTHFSSPSGVLDEGNYSSARDLAALARYALRDARLRAIVRTPRKEVSWSAPTFAKVYVNKNRLLRTYRGADGVKTGWTTVARHCIVASAHRRGIHLIAVVLGSKDAYSDARRILDHGFRIRG